MTDDLSALDTLRSEVREAVNRIEYSCTMLSNCGEDYKIIVAELLRLAEKERNWQQWIKDGMRVEFLPPEPPK